MEFGKLANIEGVDFALPADSPTTVATLRALAVRPSAASLCYVGCPQWTIKGWHGHVYPAGCSPADYLRHYARHFNAVELNSTFYAIPKLDVVARWREQVGPEFRFCPKIPKSIAQSADFAGLPGEFEQFMDVLAAFGSRLGHVFLQLPPYFGPDRLPELRLFLDRFPDNYALAVEFRHPGWLSGHPIFSELAARGVASVITDTAGRRDAAHMSVTADTVFVRFVGNDLHPSDFHRLDNWALRLSVWLKQGVRQVFFFVHEPTKALTDQASNHMVDALNASANLQLQRCVSIAPPVQGELFDFG